MTGEYFFSVYAAVALFTLCLVRVVFGRWVDWIDVTTAVLCAVFWPLAIMLVVLMLVAQTLCSLGIGDEDGWQGADNE